MWGKARVTCVADYVDFRRVLKAVALREDLQDAGISRAKLAKEAVGGAPR